jgi:hypothetical protein
VPSRPFLSTTTIGERASRRRHELIVSDGLRTGCDDARMGSRGPLVPLSVVVLGLLAAHDVTHVLDDGLGTPLGQLAYVAIPQWLFLAVAMTVVVAGDPARSRLAALLMGVSVAIGFGVIHLLPPSPASLWTLEPSVISWVLVGTTAAAGVALAAVAWGRAEADHSCASTLITTPSGARTKKRRTPHGSSTGP